MRAAVEFSRPLARAFRLRRLPLPRWIEPVGVEARPDAGAVTRLAAHATPLLDERVRVSALRAAAAVDRILSPEAVVLWGSWARGEGAVIGTGEDERPADDLDLLAVTANPDAPALQAEAARQASGASGMVVDLVVLSPSDVCRLPSRLRWHGLVRAHQVLLGPEDAVRSRAPATLREPPQAVEAVRLLLDRGTDLLRAMVRARSPGGPDPGEARQAWDRAVLAAADAVLLASRWYVPGLQARGRMLAAVAARDPDIAALELVRAHECAIRRRLRPDGASDGCGGTDLDEAAARWVGALLYVERRRTGRFFRTVDDYARWDGCRDPDGSRGWRRPRNWLRNLRARSWSARDPREPLYRRLPLLLRRDAARPGAWHDECLRYLQAWDEARVAADPLEVL